MKGKVMGILIVLFILVALVGFMEDSEKKTEDAKTLENQLTVEEISKQYKPEDIVGYREFMGEDNKEKYILLEVKEETLANRFILYNLKTGDNNILPTYPFHVQLEKIVNENHLIFITEGNHINAERDFPRRLVCLRNQDGLNPNGEFHERQEPLYLELREPVSFGFKSNILLTDFRITIEGIEVLFGPIEGFESNFYAGTVMLPATETSYNEEAGQLSIRFKETKLAENINLSILQIGNHYIKSVEVIEKDEDALVLLNIKETAVYYTGEMKIAQQDRDHFPYLTLILRGNLDL